MSEKHAGKRTLLDLSPREATAAREIALRYGNRPDALLEILHDLQEDLGVACIFITHDLGVVEHVSHDVAVLYRGSIVEMGATDRIMAAPEHQYTRTLLAAVPRPPSTHPRQGGSLA